MSSVKPSRRIFFLTVACIVGVGAIGFAVYATKVKGGETQNPVSSSNNSSQTAQIIQQALKNNAEVDDDKDNLQNWEEILWGTDQNNPDSDKDGTKDGDEVKTSRNPLKAGPEDKLTDLDETTKTKAVIQVESDATKTGELSRELFANYLRAKQAGVALDTQVQSKIIEQTFLHKNFDPTYKKYSASDIKVSAEADYKTYGNNLGLAFSLGNTDSTVSEMDIVLEAITNRRQSDLEKLDPIIAGYQTVLNAIAQVYVPKDLTELHLSLLNNMSKVVADIKGSKEVLSDPIAGLGSVGSYASDIEEMRQALINVSLALTSKGVGYESGEYGSFFLKLAQ